MAAAYLVQSKAIQIPAVYSDTSGVTWRTHSTATNRLSSHKSQPQYASEKEYVHSSRREHTQPVHTSCSVRLALAVVKIEEWWQSTKNRKVFRILKDTVRSAEQSLTNDVIRKVCPSEAELLKDPTMKTKIKFRFGGDRFPPIILFKVFITGPTAGIRYLSGKRMIQPASCAAKDAQRHMGNRVFYDQMLVDACQHQQFKITDEVDVTTMKEYMQYVATVDETPAYLGGKDNTWRKLNLEALSRHSVMYSVVELLEQSTSGGLSLEKLRSFARPSTQTDQIQRIKTVSSLGVSGSVEGGSRGSRLARQRARKMREMYGLKSPNTHYLQNATTPQSREAEREEEVGRERIRGEEGEGGEGDSDLEREASDLYQWSQSLSFEDV